MKQNLESLTLGTATWKLTFFTGEVFELMIETTMTITSSRGRSFAKCTTTFTPFESNGVIGASVPKENTREDDKYNRGVQYNVLTRLN
jgi:hypothetical protein